MKAAVIQFPGSNCDFDMYYALQDFGADVQFVTEKSTDLSAYDAVFLPGGFSYGDYLRTGAVARFAPVMTAVQKMAATGKLVVGVCNGFQILTEINILMQRQRLNYQLRTARAGMLLMMQRCECCMKMGRLS